MDRSDSNIDLCLETDSASTTTDYRAFLKTAPPMKIFENSRLKWSVHSKTVNRKNENLEAEVEKVRAHAFNLSEKCSKLENRVFSLDKFISDEDIAFYTGFPSYAAFMATCTYLYPGESGEKIRYWRSVQDNVDPEYYEREPELGGGPGRPRTLNSDVQAKDGFL